MKLCMMKANVNARKRNWTLQGLKKKPQLTATTVSILGALFKIATLVRIWKPWVARPIAAMVATQVGWEV